MAEAGVAAWNRPLPSAKGQTHPRLTAVHCQGERRGPRARFASRGRAAPGKDATEPRFLIVVGILKAADMGVAVVRRE